MSDTPDTPNIVHLVLPGFDLLPGDIFWMGKDDYNAWDTKYLVISLGELKVKPDSVTKEIKVLDLNRKVEFEYTVFDNEKVIFQVDREGSSETPETITHWHFRTMEGEDRKGRELYEETYASINSRESEDWLGFPCYVSKNDPKIYFSPTIASEIIRRQGTIYETEVDILTWENKKRKKMLVYRPDGTTAHVKASKDGLFVGLPDWGWSVVAEGWPEPEPQPGDGGGDGDCQTCGGTGKVDKDDEGDSGDGDNESEKDGQGDGDSNGSGNDSGDGDSENDGNSDENKDGQGGDNQDTCPDCGGTGKDPNQKPGDGGKEHTGEKDFGNIEGEGKQGGDYAHGKGHHRPPEVKNKDIKVKPCPTCGGQPDTVGHISNFCVKCDNFYHNEFLDRV